jgi:hypothetical protein
VTALAAGTPTEALQLAGDELIAAVAAGIPGAPELAEDCAEALR